MIITDGFVNVWNGTPHVLLLAGRIGEEGHFILDMIEFCEQNLAEFKRYSAQTAHPLRPYTTKEM